MWYVYVLATHEISCDSLCCTLRSSRSKSLEIIFSGPMDQLENSFLFSVPFFSTVHAGIYVPFSVSMQVLTSYLDISVASWLLFSLRQENESNKEDKTFVVHCTSYACTPSPLVQLSWFTHKKLLTERYHFSLVHIDLILPCGLEEGLWQSVCMCM